MDLQKLLKTLCSFLWRSTSLLIGGKIYAQSDMGFSVWDSVTDDSCTATITFLGKKEYLLESGDQVITKTYRFNQYRKTDFYVFFQKTVANNGQLSCSGVAGAREGTRIKVYAKFNAEMTEMALYSEPEEGAPIDIMYRKRQPKGQP